MDSDIEHRGEWWLPENPEKRFYGTLTFNQASGAVLELDGAFTDDPDNSELFNPHIVNGTSSTGIDITLCNCLGKGLSVYWGGQSISKLHAHDVYIGVHFKKEDEIKFRSVRVIYSQLDTWLGISGFKTKRRKTKRGKDEIVIRYTLPESVTAFISNELQLSIDYGSSFSPYAWREADLKQSCGATFLPVEKLAFEEYRDIIRQFQNFLSLATTTYVYPMRIEGTPDIDFYKDSDKVTVGNYTYAQPVEILYQLARSPQTDRMSYSTDYLFTFKSISNRFGKYLQSWFGKYELLKPVHQLYFGTLYNPTMYLDQKFLAFIQALEAYHRRTIGNCELPNEKHKERIKQILDSVTTKYMEWLKAKLDYSNEPSLRKRLKELLKSNEALTSQLTSSGKQFINDVCNTRNYLIHYDLELEDKAAKGEELHNLTQKLKVLIEACFLKQLGFNSQKVTKILSNYYRRYSFFGQ